MTAERLLAASFVLVLSACAPALREPPSVTEFAGETDARRSAAEPLARSADRAYAERTIDSVRDAARIWLDAAAADPSFAGAWIGASRARVWLAGHEPEAEAREAAATAAVQAAQLCAEHAPDMTECSYWLAVALGVQARERRATALDALPRMVALLEQVAGADPGLEHSGPDRVLALVLLRAPGWPTGPGDPDRGLAHARRAADRHPEFAPNQLCLSEGLAAAGEADESLSALDRAESLARRAADEGDPEAPEWLDQIRQARQRGWARP